VQTGRREDKIRRRRDKVRRESFFWEKGAFFSGYRG